MSAVRSSSEVVSEVFSEYVQCVSAVRFSVSICSEVLSEMIQYLSDVCGICVFGIFRNARWGPIKQLEEAQY